MKFSWRIWLLIIALLASILVISPNFEKGVLIKSVEPNSTALESGLNQNMIIKSINGEKVDNLDDYFRILNSIFPVQNKTKLIINSQDSEMILFTDKAPEILVSNLPKTKIKTGLDLSGGARALVKPVNMTLSDSEADSLIDIMSNRLNTFGIKDVMIKKVSDSPIGGNNFVLVEVAGATPSDLEELISKQGKFEAKIGNETVFIGGENDITYVARTGEQAGIYNCRTTDSGDICYFRFPITISSKAAEKFALITRDIPVNSSLPGYLDKTIDFYIDDKLTESLNIDKNLKNSATNQHSIQGSGTGSDRQSAYDNALNDMKHLQTILKTGSLPYKLEIVKIDTISPVLGKEFTKNMIYLAVIVFVIISLILFIKYRKIKITLSVILTMFSEAFITLAIAALIKWNLDAPGIAGIIAGMGTGVNDQIVILDETILNKQISLKERIKNALFIIFGAFFTIFAAMIPLFWAGAGMLKGFALTTIIGVSVGILITRPAFAEIIKLILKE